MAQEASLVSLGELLEETGVSEGDNEILERLKLLAQELLPEGWTTWKVTRLSRENIFGESVDPQVLNKLRFALPTDQIAKAFVPEATRLSEKGFRDIKLKMLDWAFTRALITSPPAVCNKIRGSAAATELFNVAVRPERAMSRREADRALSLDADSERTSMKRRRVSSDPESNDAWANRSKRSRIDILEQRMNEMFSNIMDKIDSLTPATDDPSRESSPDEKSSSYEEDAPASSRMESPNDWHAPPLGSGLEPDSVSPSWPELEFLPAVKEVEPAIPTPSEHIKAEGIACQRFGSEAWNRIRYKEVVKRLHASPVFSALKVNAELSDLGIQTSGLLSKQDGVLGTIVHGLLCQRKALAEELKKLAADFPAAATDLKKLLSEDSDFRATSDDLLQYVCAHRAETIELRRKNFRTKSDALTSLLQKIPPSETHLFQEERLSSFVRDNGGASRIFPSRFGRAPDKERRPFQQSGKGSQPVTPRTQRSKNPGWHTRSSQASKQKQSSGKPKRVDKKEQRQQRRKY